MPPLVIHHNIWPPQCKAVVIKTSADSSGKSGITSHFWTSDACTRVTMNWREPHIPTRATRTSVPNGRNCFHPLTLRRSTDASQADLASIQRAMAALRTAFM